MKKYIQKIFSRAGLVTVLLLAQILLLVAAVSCFSEYAGICYMMCELLSLSVVVYIIGNDSNPGYKVSWIVLILLLPLFGGVFYIVFGNNNSGRRSARKLKPVIEELRGRSPDNSALIEELRRSDAAAAVQARYINDFAYAPLWSDTETQYCPLGELGIQALIDELKKAENFIFLEFFIIHPGSVWDSVHEILREKAAAGVEVRLMYDDFGCILSLPENYPQLLEKEGINCCVFNKVRPVLDIKLNNRDHRKICVVDGKLGVSGGINLADEYANRKTLFGHWKDSAILLRGSAVFNMTLMFLTMWQASTGVKENCERYLVYEPRPARGYVQPYGDYPQDDEPVGETVYLNIINRATSYVHIMTPYFIIDNEMLTSLIDAAKSGVDVAVILPRIPDKKIAFFAARSFYHRLLHAGVNIYEYTPGFVHAKSMVSDDCTAVIGTINLDYRSLYLHYECGVWMHGTDSIADMESDFQKTAALSDHISYAQYKSTPIIKKIMYHVVRFFAPLM